MTDHTPPGWLTVHPPNDGPGRFITGQLLFRHRDGGILRETHIGDAAIPRRDEAEFGQTMRDLAAELRRAADLLDPPPQYPRGVNPASLGMNPDTVAHLWPSEGPVPPEIETP